MTLGNILAILAGILTVYLTWIAAIVATALIATDRVAAARENVEHKLARSIWIGIAAIAITLLICHPFKAPPPIKILDLIYLAALGAAGLLGTAAVARLMACRIDQADEGPLAFTVLFRSAALIAGASLTPVVGWFFLLPALLVVSLGAGLSSVFGFTARATPRQVAAAPNPQA